jgi:hypothetical protein
MQYIKLDIKECNLDMDILATTPTIKTERMNTHLSDGEGKHTPSQPHAYNGYGHNIAHSKIKINT